MVKRTVNAHFENVCEAPLWIERLKDASLILPTPLFFFVFVRWVTAGAWTPLIAILLLLLLTDPLFLHWLRPLAAARIDHLFAGMDFDSTQFEFRLPGP